ncbi:MAG: trehalose-phosphatase [Planctomycetota bacterium]
MSLDETNLSAALAELARTPFLLVASDYDGTVAPIVDDPAAASPNREALVALRSLAELPHTEVALISGRSLADLAQLSGAPEGVHLVGSHGSEFDPGFASGLDPATVALLGRVVGELETIAGSAAGLVLEPKPASVAFHFRNADEAAAARAIHAILSGPATLEGVATKHGKEVLELSVVDTNKGDALNELRRRFGATALVFLGDDVTDEDAFRVLGVHDVGVKVGAGESLAGFRVDDSLTVARVLAQLTEARRRWLFGEHAVPIQEHSLLSDQRTVALVTPDASIDWFVAPRIDSQALFAALLGDDQDGRFAIRAADGAAPIGQRYLDASLVLETRFPTFTVTDFLDCSLDRPSQRAGRSDLVRRIEGEGSIEIEFAPRIDFGRIETRLHAGPTGLVVEGGADGIVLIAKGVNWKLTDVGRHHTATARVMLLPGQPLDLELRYGAVDLFENGSRGDRRLVETLDHWRDWARRLELPGVAPELVRHSALILRGLVHRPTGAIAAAATTSLPEVLGGIRNWDYRYCWLRDGAQSAEALVRLGSLREGLEFLQWVLGLVDRCQSPERLHPLYTVSGDDLGPEAEIASLAGYRASRPVRVGNAASNQVQLDVFGPIAELVSVLIEAGAPLSMEHWRLLENLVHAVEARWMEPDHGIWEIRARPRHHVHSRVMCWLTLDRAETISRRYRGVPRPEWRALADTIRNEVLERGWNEARGAFTAAYDADDLDAAALWVGLSGLLDPLDDRFRRTVTTIERELGRGPVVDRYHANDGLPGHEGGFLLCASWLIDALILVDRPGEARERFDALAALPGRTGCLAEEFDPEAGLALGNHPQAYSHLGLILNALHLDSPG